MYCHALFLHSCSRHLTRHLRCQVKHVPPAASSCDRYVHTTNNLMSNHNSVSIETHAVMDIKYWQHISQCVNIQMVYSGMPNRRARLLIYFSFLLTWPKLISPYPLILSGLVRQPVLSSKSDRPTETINPVNFDYFTCHLWDFCHLLSVYIAYCIKKQSLLNTIVYARGLNPK